MHLSSNIHTSHAHHTLLSHSNFVNVSYHRPLLTLLLTSEHHLRIRVPVWMAKNSNSRHHGNSTKILPSLTPALLDTSRTSPRTLNSSKILWMLLDLASNIATSKTTDMTQRTLLAQVTSVISSMMMERLVLPLVPMLRLQALPHVHVEALLMSLAAPHVLELSLLLLLTVTLSLPKKTGNSFSTR